MASRLFLCLAATVILATIAYKAFWHEGGDIRRLNEPLPAGIDLNVAIDRWRLCGGRLTVGLGVGGRVEEVAGAVGWLCSAEASGVNGQAIAVAGGET